jgi:hypothetical protein
MIVDRTVIVKYSNEYLTSQPDEGRMPWMALVVLYLGCIVGSGTPR